MEKSHINALLDLYYELITAKEFMDYLNSQPDLQQKFDSVLKRSVPSDGGTPMEWLNLIASRIGTDKDSALHSSDGEHHIWSNSSQSYLILLYVQEFMAKSDAICYLDRDVVDGLIVAAVTDTDSFYNASPRVEAYIKTKIIAGMPQIKTLNSAVKYVKKQMKERFICDDKMPKWLQGCEWAFNEDGEPMIFKSESGGAYHKTFTFYDNTDGKEVVVEQFN